eukprot:408981-Pelagomonas_calceolata.AAC.1
MQIAKQATTLVTRACYPDCRLPQPNGAEITNTIVRAELAAIAAAILKGYSHIGGVSQLGPA